MPQRSPRFLNDNDSPPMGVDIAVVEARTVPGEWVVEAIDYGAEGEIYRAVFSGPMAEQRARDYARLVYGAPAGLTQSSTSI
jgi:hypothetical protein